MFPVGPQKTTKSAFCNLSPVFRDARNFENQSWSLLEAFEGKNWDWTRLSITDQLGTKKFEAIQILRSAYKNKVFGALEETTATALGAGLWKSKLYFVPCTWIKLSLDKWFLWFEPELNQNQTSRTGSIGSVLGSGSGSDKMGGELSRTELQHS